MCIRDSFEIVDLFEQPLDTAALKALLGRLGLRPRDVLRSRDPAYAELGLDDPKASDARLLAALAAHPGLIQRPIVARGKKAVVARPVERAAAVVDAVVPRWLRLARLRLRAAVVVPVRVRARPIPTGQSCTLPRCAIRAGSS